MGYHLPVYDLKLYITGASPNSTRAVINTRALCEKYLKNRYQLQVIDIYQQPIVAQHDQIIALPLLIKAFPLPAKKLIGSMDDTNKVLESLGVIETVNPDDLVC